MRQVAIQLVAGLLLSGLIGFIAYRRRSLTRSGVWGAILVGTAIFGFGGWVWGMLLITFFVLSSLLSHFRESVKIELAEKFAKGHQRDLGQVLANGGAGALIAVASAVYPHPAMFMAFLGAIATVNADTWATELGVLSKGLPRLITSWQRVERGTSGGISSLGTGAAAIGAAVIGLAALGYLALDGLFDGAGLAGIGIDGACKAFQIVLVAAAAGWAGSTFDSLLGATVQAIYTDPRRLKETEKRYASDGQPNVHQRGWRWLGNDLVNLASSFVGVAAALLVWRVCGVLSP